VRSTRLNIAKDALILLPVYGYRHVPDTDTGSTIKQRKWHKEHISWETNQAIPIQQELTFDACSKIGIPQDSTQLKDRDSAR